MKKEVVITGLGAITPIGNNVQEFEAALFQGKSGGAPISRFEPGELPTRFAAEVKGYETKYRDIKIDFALEAARETFKNSFPDSLLPPNTRAGLSIGLGLELFSVEDLAEYKKNDLFPENWSDRLMFLNTPTDLCIHLIGHELKLNLAPETHISACAAGTDALGSAFRQIRNGKADVVLAGGTDSMINPMGLAGFCKIGAPSTRNHEPTKASRPFDVERDGFLLGEGAAFVTMEEKEFAVKRGAKILATIKGYGNSLDAFSISDPHPEGAGALAAMRGALQEAEIKPEKISAISVHGTSTPKNDPAESKAIRTLLGDHWKNTSVFATKSMIGHLISAAGSAEAVAAILCLQNQKIHATINLEKPDVGCELRHVMKEPEEREVDYILSNSFGFGGQNASIVLGRYAPTT